MSPRIYLDHNACTPVDPRVLERFAEAEEACPANPGSLHRSGRKSRSALENAREDIADALGVAATEITFVSGGTEANNTVVHGAGDPSLPVLLAPVEHPSVLAAAERRGARWWQVDPGGRAIVREPDADVGLVCLVHAQNETGVMQPIDEATALARAMGVPFHVDASQSLGRIPVSGVFERADSVAISSHKLGGLRGLAVLWCRASRPLRPLVVGGSQEQGMRAGTPSPGLAAATALAIRLAVEETEARGRAMDQARAAFEAGLADDLRMRRLTNGAAVPNTVMYLFEELDGRSLLPALDLAGVEASQGSACSTGSPTPPPVLAAMGIDDDDARRCVRFSFGWHTSYEDATAAAGIVSETVRSLQARSSHA